MGQIIDDKKQLIFFSNCKQLFTDMESRLIERDQAIRLIALTFFFKTNCFLIGERGGGKSYAIEMLGNIIKGAGKLWQLMLKKDTKTEEIFGRTYQTENGEWKINTKNSLLEATNVFTDEMFKADGKILSGLLEVLIDRCYSFGDGQKIKTNIIAFFGASNEYPTERFMLPYVDRFLIWIEIKQIQDEENRKRYYLGDYIQSPIESGLFNIEDIEYIYNESKKIAFSEELIDTYVIITKAFIQSGVKTSDRKYKSIIGLIKTIAYLNNRKSVNLSDLFILLFSAWQDQNEKEKVKDILFEKIFDTKQNVITLVEDVNKLIKEQESEFKRHSINFSTYKLVFSGDNQHLVFEENKKDIQIFIENFEYLLNDRLNKIEKIDLKNKFIMKLIDENIFILDIRENVFNEKIVEDINKLKNNLKDKISELKTWIGKNKTLFAYKNNQNENM